MTQHSQLIHANPCTCTIIYHTQEVVDYDCGNTLMFQRDAAGDLLHGTELFMRLAGHLDDPVNLGDTDWSSPERTLRQVMLREEVQEYTLAETLNDPVEILDGLLDIIVIAWGTALKYYGEEKAKAAAAEVVRSNLSKVDGSLGPIVRREDGKILKPEGWTPPDIAGVLSD